jgi:hypothetical protein
MTRQTVLLLPIVVMFTACARPAPEQRVVRDAASALGGAEKVLAVNTLVIEGEGAQ